MHEPPVLTTPRLLLRELALRDLEPLAPMLAHPEVMRFWPAPLSRAEARGWIERQRERYRRDGRGYWLATLRESGQVVGQAGLLVIHLAGRREEALGYVLDRAFWGRGLATEAAVACRDHAFSVLGASSVVAPIRPENVASRKVAERVGLWPGPTVRYAGFEHVVFRLDREAWRAQAERAGAGRGGDPSAG